MSISNFILNSQWRSQTFNGGGQNKLMAVQSKIEDIEYIEKKLHKFI